MKMARTRKNSVSAAPFDVLTGAVEHIPYRLAAIRDRWCKDEGRRPAAAVRQAFSCSEVAQRVHAARVAEGDHPAEKTRSLLLKRVSPYVCPEPVLVNQSF